MKSFLRHWPPADPSLFRQQEFLFCLLNLFVIVFLLAANLLLADVWGRVTPFLFVTMLLGFLGHLALLFWLLSSSPSFPSSSLRTVTTVSILINTALTLASSATNRNDSQYYILMCVPVLQAAFRYSLASTISVVALADFLNFFWIFQYYRLHGGHVEVDEYVEAGTVSFIYSVIGIVAWILVDNLRRKELFLADSLDQLRRTRSHLLAEEKLAVVGRLSSAIAEQLRNPLDSITNSLAAARRKSISPSEQAALFDSVLSESSRLASLTSDFVSFSHPLNLNRTQVDIAGILRSVAAGSQQQATSQNLKIVVTAPASFPALVDETQIRLALSHLLAFAIDASPSNHSILLRADSLPGGSIQLQIEHTSPPISPDNLALLFEPFFRNGSLGSGLGLAITRHICHAHGGDVSLTQSPNHRLNFTIDLPAFSPTPSSST
jgi:signal transduction histidine kinase